MMSRARWSLGAASTTVVAMARFAAGALGESAPPDIGSRIMVGPSIEPVSAELGGGVRVGPGGDGGTTGPAAEPVTATPPGCGARTGAASCTSAAAGRTGAAASRG